MSELSEKNYKITIIKILNKKVEKMDNLHEKIRKSNGNGRNGIYEVKNKIYIR